MLAGDWISVVTEKGGGYIPTLEPATEQVLIKASWAALLLSLLQFLSRAAWTSWTSWPQMAERSWGDACWPTTPRRQAGGLARTPRERERMGRRMVARILVVLFGSELRVWGRLGG